MWLVVSRWWYRLISRFLRPGLMEEACGGEGDITGGVRFLCPEAVILFVHLWMCMKNIVDVASVVVKKNQKNKTALLTEALWHTVGRRHRARSRGGAHHDTVLLNWTQICLSCSWMSQTDPGSFLSSSIFKMPLWEQTCFSDQCLFTDVQHVKTHWRKQKKQGFFSYSFCLMRWWRRRALTSRFFSLMGENRTWFRSHCLLRPPWC